MASAENSTQPTCPVCHQSDQVKTTQAAYNSGIARCAPPDMPTRNISMMPYITTCILLVGVFIFMIIVFIGGLEGKFPIILQLILACLTIISIITALVVSYYAFQKVVSGDVETTRLFPIWDSAMTRWKALYYCSRDDVVFDPKINQVVTNEQLTSLRAVIEPINAPKSALASH